jgi:hypothetical protein
VIPEEATGVEVAENGTVVATSSSSDSSLDVACYNTGDSGSVASSFSMKCELQEDGSWVCRPYKIEILQQQIKENSPGSGRRTAIIETLRQMGVKVFIIDGRSVEGGTEGVLEHVKRVVGFVARENCVLPAVGSLGYERVLLYQDKGGRLFNLSLSKHAVGPASTWLEYLDTFSGKEAMIAVTVLCRSFPCITLGTYEERLESTPTYSSLIISARLVS